MRLCIFFDLTLIPLLKGEGKLPPALSLKKEQDHCIIKAMKSAGTNLELKAFLDFSNSFIPADDIPVKVIKLNGFTTG
jgi:hypothetical protein